MPHGCVGNDPDGCDFTSHLLRVTRATSRSSIGRSPRPPTEPETTVVKDERGRPRTTAPFTWGHDFAAALAQAKTSGKKVFVDFEATWCGPCKTMDEWIWTDADVAARLSDGFVGVKLDGDIEKAIVKRYTVKGYPTMLVLDAAGCNRLRAHGA